MFNSWDLRLTTGHHYRVINIHDFSRPCTEITPTNHSRLKWPVKCRICITSFARTTKLLLLCNANTSAPDFHVIKSTCRTVPFDAPHYPVVLCVFSLPNRLLHCSPRVILDQKKKLISALNHQQQPPKRAQFMALLTGSGETYS